MLVVEQHTDDPTFGFRVRDDETEETYGFGLTFDHAAALLEQLDLRRPIV
jgi:hypothetical protein